MNKSFGRSDIIDRVLSKFGMAKRGSQRTTSVDRTELVEKDNSSVTKLACHGSQETTDATDTESESQKVSLQDLPTFCERLETFIHYIRNVRDLQFLIYDYPVIVRNRFDDDIFELKDMLTEINSSLANINKQKLQHNCVKKEKMAVKKTLTKLRDEEYREMEKVVALYDKTLFTRWEGVKMTHKPEILKSLLTDIKCKQLALENLDTLITRRLENLKTYSLLSVNKSNKSDQEKAIIPGPLLSICPVTNENSNQRKSRIPLPPPLPPPPSLASRNNARSLSLQRRRRDETEDDFDSQCSLIQDIDDLLEISSPSSVNAPRNLIVSIGENFRPQGPSHFSNGNPTFNDELLAASLQAEMRAVLQVSDDFSHSV